MRLLKSLRQRWEAEDASPSTGCSHGRQTDTQFDNSAFSRLGRHAAQCPGGSSAKLSEKWGSGDLTPGLTGAPPQEEMASRFRLHLRL